MRTAADSRSGSRSGARAPAWVRAVDRLSAGIGRTARWLTLAMVLLGSYNVLARYLGRYVGWGLASNAYIELQWYLFSAVFLLGAAYTLQQGAHVRVDVLYGRLRPRTRAWIDLFGTLLLLIPFSLLVIAVSWPAVRNSWSVLEGSPDPGGLPRYPLKTLIPVSFGLLILQGAAEAMRRVAWLRGRSPLPSDSTPAPEDRP